MDANGFDRLTRRFVVAGLPGGSLAALLGVFEVTSKKNNKKPSKRKRCRKKHRRFCSGRCCPKHHRCEAKTCVQSCENPFVCPDQGGGSGCGAGTNCFCSTTIRGTTACVISESAPCEDFDPCSPTDSCPAGLICAICECVGDAPDFRCKRPCRPVERARATPSLVRSSRDGRPPVRPAHPALRARGFAAALAKLLDREATA